MKLIMITLMLVLVSCEHNNRQPSTHNLNISSNPEKINDDTINIKDNTRGSTNLFKHWVYKIRNNDPSQIGYKIYTNDESIGVKSIYPSGNYIYLTDVYHTNIKKINLITGKMISSRSIADAPADVSGVWLRDIAVFNDNIYAPSDGKLIYVFSPELKLKRKIVVNNGIKRIESVTNDHINIFLSDKQLKNKSIEERLLVISKNGDTMTVNKYIPIGEYTKMMHENIVQGKTYSIVTHDGKNYFKNKFGIIELNQPIPHIETYDAINVNFSDSELVYFNIDSKEFNLYIYRYN